MNLLKNNRGITLIALIITIIILLILAGTATFSGISTIQSAKMTTFTTEMKMIQTEVSSLKSKIEEDENENKVINERKLNDFGIKIPNENTNEDIKNLKEDIENLNSENEKMSENSEDIFENYRYYDSEKLKSDFGIEGIKQVAPVLINLEKGSVISVKGIKYQGQAYHRLEDIPQYTLNKINQVEIEKDNPTFVISTETTKNEMKIILTNIEINAEYVKKYDVQYQIDGNNSWTTLAEDLTTDNYTFQVKMPGIYNVKVIDAQGNEKTEPIEVKHYKLISDGSWSELKGVNTPKLEDTDLKGIYWDENGNEIEVNKDNQNEWYDYNSQKWANAKSSDGSYWVWIPRFAYKINSNLGTNEVGEIEIRFIDINNKNDEIEYSENYPTVESNSMTDFVVHPAFTENIGNGGWDKNISGFWIAKYAAGFQECTQEIDENGNITEPTIDTSKIVYSDKNYTSNNDLYTVNALNQDLSAQNYRKSKISYPVFKPLTYAYNIISASDSFIISKEIANANFYGLNANNIDSHMIKNSEWGAVVYLSRSSYGKNGSDVISNNKNLNNLNNKNIYAVTGYTEETTTRLEASSTSNINGVFDLSGCIWERTSGFISNGNENLLKYGNSILKNCNVISNGNSPQAESGESTKYSNIYLYDTLNDNENKNFEKNKNFFGDAIIETSMDGNNNMSWDLGYSNFPRSNGPFFVRGGFYQNNICEDFAYGNTEGNANIDIGFRSVLIVE